LHGTTSCVTGNCQPVCDLGYGNCDLIASNGCETLLGTIANCANCSNACLTGQNCTLGVCMTPQVPTCGDGTCNGTETCSNCVPDCACLNGYTCATNGTCMPAGSCTCAALGFDCGFQIVCGVLTNCGGGCPSGQDCNSGGQCVPGTCDDTCTTIGKTNACGWISDICGLNTWCGQCSYGLDCINNVCTPANCAKIENCSTLGYGCGIHNVCGVQTNCGGCPSGESCQNGNTVCISDYCFDGIPNNGETGTDCGGQCKDCILIADYYVAPWGNDNNPGTFDLPWGTWQKAFDLNNGVGAGDLVYFRGGVYYYNGTAGNIRISYNTTPDAPIRFFAYPGDTERPILDLKFRPKTSSNYGLLIARHWTQNENYTPSNLYFKGLEIRNVLMQDETVYDVRALQIWEGDNITFENMIIHDNGGKSFACAFNTGSVKFINCDAYNNIDWYNYGAVIQEVPTLENSLYIGGGAGGIIGDAGDVSYPDFNNPHVYMYGCRAWNNSDGGIGIGGAATVLLNNVWSFRNGRALGDGYGIKGYGGYGPSWDPTKIRKVVVNSVSAENMVGFDQNNDPERWAIYNTFSYKNGWQPWISGLYEHCAYTFCSGSTYSSIFSNNIAYKSNACDTNNVSGASQVCFKTSAVQSNNNWNLGGVTVNDADFVSLDVSQLRRPRHANGSLPDITFGHLVAGSDLIDAGVKILGVSELIDPRVNVTLPYLGSNPDLGAFEHS
jgi:hypothetical protein